MSFSWRVTPQEVWIPLYAQQAEQIEAGIVAIADGLTDEIADWMRADHPWENRTGDAEAGLYSDVSHAVRQSVTIIVSHGPAIPYAIFLELANGGRFAIIADTVDWWGPRVFHEVQALLRQVMG